ncbi:hypothetical protein [Algoriphagus sediminis]|uniref:hypothetical protein n=1 Tax=Algoriphagus sediminis TaxID=3057113 RepID=UPI0025B23F76|nr:hypothetical protein [Algoriphagus sediminis]
MKSSKLFSICLFVMFTIFFCGSQKTDAGTSYLKENALQIVYDTDVQSGVEVAGTELPLGIVVRGGHKALGVMGICQWAFSTCDTDKNVFTPF